MGFLKYDQKFLDCALYNIIRAMVSGVGMPVCY